MARILLTGGRAPATLELARLFWRQGHQVEIAASWGISACRFSRAARRHWPLPPPRQASAAFSQAPQQLTSQRGHDLLIPTREEVFWVTRARPLLEPRRRVLCPSLAALRGLHDKHAFSELIGRCGRPGPATTLLHSPQAVRRCAAGAPASVYKPSFSRFGTQTLIRLSWATARDVMYAPHDRLPALAQPLLGASLARRAARLRVGLLAATTHDIEWNGEA